MGFDRDLTDEQKAASAQKAASRRWYPHAR